MKKSLFGFIIFFGLCVSLFAQKPATLTKSDDALYWTISGTDANGNPSTVHILGTFHIGDKRLYPLPEHILNDFDNADTLCGEISSEGWAQFQSKLTGRLLSMTESDESKWINNVLTPEELDIVLSVLPEKQANYLFYFKPVVLYMTLSSIPYQQMDFEFVTAYDQFLIQRADSQGRHMDGLDALETQLDCLFYGDYDIQLGMLKEAIKLIDEPEETQAFFTGMYEAYLSHDEDIMSYAYFSELEFEIKENPDMKAYYELLLDERNKDWAVKIADYLNKGGTTFIFAGTGHFLGQSSVFNVMRANGTLK